MPARPPRYLECTHKPCTQRRFFGTKFIEIVRHSRGHGGWLFWRCLACGQINSDPVTSFEIWQLKRAHHAARIRDIYSPEFCQNIIHLSCIHQSAPDISPEELEEMLTTIYSSKLEDDAYDLHRCMRDVRLRST